MLQYIENLPCILIGAGHLLFMGDFMKKRKIASAAISVVLAIIMSLAGAVYLVLIMTRDYYTSDMFDIQVENTDLSSLKFIYNSEKVTLEAFVKDYVNTNVDDFILDKAGQFYSELWFPFADKLTDYTIEKAFSSEYINNLVKGEFKGIVDYFLYSDVDKARKRLKNGTALEENYELNPDNTSDYEEKIKAQVKLAVLQYIEYETGTSCDKIIIILSESTASVFSTVTIILAAVILLLNIKSIVNIFAYLGAAFCGCSGVITYIRNAFDTHFDGMKDLITYELFEPVAETCSQYAEKTIIYGIISLVIFAALTTAHNLLKKKKFKL